MYRLGLCTGFDYLQGGVFYRYSLCTGRAYLKFGFIYRLGLCGDCFFLYRLG